MKRPSKLVLLVVVICSAIGTIISGYLDLHYVFKILLLMVFLFAVVFYYDEVRKSKKK